jgi:hypothetical protein
MRTIVVVLVLLGAAAPALAQQTPARYSVEAVGGYHPFVAEGIDHLALGTAARIRLGRWHLGPELIYLKGPEFDDDLVLNATAVFDVVKRADAVPFLVMAGGAMHHWGEFDRESGWAPFVDFGGGLRITATDRIYAAVEVRIGLEAHVRLTGSVGWRLRR